MGFEPAENLRCGWPSTHFPSWVIHEEWDAAKATPTERGCVACSRGLQYAPDRQGSGCSAVHRQQLASALQIRAIDQPEDRPRAGKKPIYGHVTNKRI